MKKQNKSETGKFKILVLLIVIAAIAFAAAAYFSGGKTEDFLKSIEDREAQDENIFQEGLVTAGTVGGEGDINLWKTSKGHLTIEAPHAWEVQQHDFGGGSAIFVYDPEAFRERISIWLYTPQERDETPVSLQDWADLVTAELMQIDDCKAIQIGGLSMFCRIGSQDELTRRMYFGTVNKNLYVNVSKPLEEERDTELWEIINTLDLNPDEETLESAHVIP